MSARRLAMILALSGLSTACGHASPAPKTGAPAARPAESGTASPGTSARPSELAEPPAPAQAPIKPFPKIEHETLGNGLAIRVMQRSELPIVELRLVLFSGQATDGDKPGLAAVAGELLKAGGAGEWNARALLEAAESLGGQLDVSTDRDATIVSLAVSARDFERALAIIGAVAQKPRFDAAEFGKLKQRELERVTSLSRTSPGWMASTVLYRELFHLPTSVHPYAQYDATQASLAKLTLGHCKAWHKAHFVPKNAALVVGGNVTPSAVKEAAARVFGDWKGDAPSRPSFATPMPPAQNSIYVVNRPQSPQAQIYVATLGPERKSPDWPALKVTNQILGGGVSGRLFLDVRERRSLAYSTSSSVEELSHGPVPLMLSAGTQTAKAGLAVAGLLEHIKKLNSSSPTPLEVATATRYLSDSFAISIETTGAVTGLATRLAVFGLPDDYYDDYRAAVRSVGADQVRQVAARYFRDGANLIVVAGDAERLTRPLSHFARVTVIDPEHGFSVGKVVPQDPKAPLSEAPAAK